jgi:hypothetical protein
MKSRYIVYSRLLIALLLGAGFMAGPSLAFIGCRYAGTHCSDVYYCDVCPAQVYVYVCPDGTIIQVGTGKCCICT